MIAKRRLRYGHNGRLKADRVYRIWRADNAGVQDRLMCDRINGHPGVFPARRMDVAFLVANNADMCRQVAVL